MTAAWNVYIACTWQLGKFSGNERNIVNYSVNQRSHVGLQLARECIYKYLIKFKIIILFSFSYDLDASSTCPSRPPPPHQDFRKIRGILICKKWLIRAKSSYQDEQVQPEITVLDDIQTTSCICMTKTFLWNRPRWPKWIFNRISLHRNK